MKPCEGSPRTAARWKEEGDVFKGHTLLIRGRRNKPSGTEHCVPKGKEQQPGIPDPLKISCGNEGRVKPSSDAEKLKERKIRGKPGTSGMWEEQQKRSREHQAASDALGKASPEK